MRLELLSGDTIEVINATVEIPINPDVLTEDMKKQLNKNIKLAILKPDTNIAIKNNVAIPDPTRTIGYITHINEKSVFAEIYDAYYLKNLYDLFIEPILINVSKDDIFVIFECYINKDGDLDKYRAKDSKEAFKNASTYNTVSGVLTTPQGGGVYASSAWNKAETDKPITKQDVNIKSDASTNGLEDIAKPKEVIKSKEQEDFENSFYI